MVSHPGYRAFFSKPFSTFVLTRYAIKPGGGMYKWRNGFSDDAYREVESQFHEVNRCLLQTYRGTTCRAQEAQPATTSVIRQARRSSDTLQA